MTNNIPNLKIGMNLNELSDFVKSQKNTNEAAVKSIFNFINDEAQCGGDNKISNENELQILESFFKDLFNVDVNKKTQVNMPKEADGSSLNNPVSILPDHDNDGESDGVSVSEGNKQTIVLDSETSTTMTERYGDGLKSDTLIDVDGDGKADRREVTVIEKGITTTYYDDDLDGDFDRKDVVRDISKTGETVMQYERDENGEWRLRAAERNSI